MVRCRNSSRASNVSAPNPASGLALTWEMSDLAQNALRRQDESPDERFYRQPRFVTHIDEGAITAVAQLYLETLPPGSAILDLMSS